MDKATRTYIEIFGPLSTANAAIAAECMLGSHGQGNAPRSNQRQLDQLLAVSGVSRQSAEAYAAHRHKVAEQRQTKSRADANAPTQQTAKVAAKRRLRLKRVLSEAYAP